jgi:DNA-binding winged helix-turn-helix (wHTH) protein
VHISALRKALEEDRDEENWSVTAPGRGYRMVPEPEAPAAAIWSPQ